MKMAVVVIIINLVQFVFFFILPLLLHVYEFSSSVCLSIPKLIPILIPFPSPIKYLKISINISGK